jgi:hypothetical protein
MTPLCFSSSSTHVPARCSLATMKRPHKHLYDLPELLGPTNRQLRLFHAPYWLSWESDIDPAALRSTLDMFPIQPMIKTEVYHKERPINKGSLGASARANLSNLGINECSKGTTTIKQPDCSRSLWRPYLPDSTTSLNLPSTIQVFSSNAGAQSDLQ